MVFGNYDIDFSWRIE